MTKPASKAPAKRAAPARAEFVEHVRVVVYRDGDAWLAHCLEFDLVAQGDTPAEARKGIDNALAAMLEYAADHGDFRPLYRPAPPELWEKFERARLAQTKSRGDQPPRVRPEVDLVTA